MKRINFQNRSLIVISFIICVGFYLFLSVGNPLLHNHHEENEQHHDCPACEFLSVVSLFDMPDIEPILVFLCQVQHAIIPDDQRFSRDTHGQSFLSRAPPILPIS